MINHSQYEQKPPFNEELSKISIEDLIPNAVREAAKQPENIDVIRLKDVNGGVHFAVVEHNCEGLTNPEQWLTWQTARDRAIAQKGVQPNGLPNILLLPRVPEGINNLHVYLEPHIRSGNLELTDRILLLCKLNIDSEGEKKLVVDDFNGEKGIGIATDFYTNTLPSLAKKLGIRYIFGKNNPQNVSFFTEKLGRYTLSQLKPEAAKALFPNLDSRETQNQAVTIQFLYSEDVEKNVQESQVKQK